VAAIRAPAKFEPRPLTSSASAHLDLIRASAAWAVMWGHLRALFFVDFSHLYRTNRWLAAIYFMTGFGHQSVMVFFVLSGFLISTSLMKKYIAGTWSAGDYGIDRASRLYVVLIPGLVLGLLWDWAGHLLFRSSGLYSQPLEAFGTIIAQDQLSFKTFVGNLFFLQTILCPTLGSNGPLWSLANEFWYYVLFPMILLSAVAWRKLSFRLAIPMTILTFCVAGFVGLRIFEGFFVWLTGFALVLAYGNFRFRRKTAWIGYFLGCLAGFSTCLVAARTGKFGILGTDFLVGLSFAFFLFSFVQMEWEPANEHYANTTRFFSDFSYSLYVLHFPFLLFLRAWISPSGRWEPDSMHLLYGALIGLLVIGYAWAISMYTEKRTRMARGWIRGVIGHFHRARD